MKLFPLLMCGLLSGASVVVLSTTSVSSASAAAASSSAPAQTITSADRTFMAENAQTDLAELASAKIAAQRSGTPAVTSLVAQIQKDHTAALAKLRVVARQLGVQLPTSPNAAQLAAAKKLQQATSGDFDRAYLQDQATGHQQSILDTETELRHGANPSVKAFARYYLPTAQMHLGMINQAIQETHVAVNQVAPPGSSTGVATPTVSHGQFAHGAKTKPSSNSGWLIGLLVVVVLALAALLLRLRRSSRSGRSGRSMAH